MTPAERTREAYRLSKRNILHALSRLLADQPFYGNLVVHVEATPTFRVETIASDGVKLYYNPIWTAAVEDEHLQFCILRIITGLALTHHLRRDDREEINWQLASLIISLTTLYQHDCVSIYDLFFDPRQWDTWVENAYERLPPQPPPPPGGGAGDGEPSQGVGQSAQASNGQPSDDDDGESSTGAQGGPNEQDDQDDDQQPDNGPQNHPQDLNAQMDDDAQVIDLAQYGVILDAPLPDNATQSQREQARQEQQQRWSDATEQSLFLMKSQGHDPGMFESFIQAYRRHKIDWRETLRDLIDDNTRVESTWSYPNRRFAASGMYLPGNQNAGCPPIYFAVDTSGSVSDHELSLVWTEVKAAAEAAQPDHIRVIQCDAAVHSDEQYECEDIPDQTMFKGRGGTAFSPVFELVNDEPIPPACLIYLTDLYCDDYRTLPFNYPVIWVATPDSSPNDPPWGFRVNINE